MRPGTHEGTWEGLVQDLLVFLVRGCNFDGMASKRKQNHNRLCKGPFYAARRPNSLMRRHWAFRQSGDIALGIFRNRTACSCSEDSENRSWPFTRAHERYQGRTVTTVTCLKHPWSLRLYDPKNMKFVKPAEERKFRRQIQSGVDQAHQTNVHAAMAGI